MVALHSLVAASRQLGLPSDMQLSIVDLLRTDLRIEHRGQQGDAFSDGIIPPPCYGSSMYRNQLVTGPTCHQCTFPISNAKLTTRGDGKSGVEAEMFVGRVAIYLAKQSNFLEDLIGEANVQLSEFCV
jgi:hypothetical protein